MQGESQDARLADLYRTGLTTRRLRRSGNTHVSVHECTHLNFKVATRRQVATLMGRCPWASERFRSLDGQAHWEASVQKCHCSGVHAGLTCVCTPMVDVTDPPPPPQVACPSASGAGVFFLTVRRPHPWLPRGRIGRGPPAGRVLNSCRLRGPFGFSLPGFQPIGDGACP